MVQNIIDDLRCLTFEPVIVESIGQRHESVQPVGDAFIENRILGRTAEPSGIRDDRIEIMLMTGEPSRHRLHLILEPSQRFDAAKGKRGKGEWIHLYQRSVYWLKIPPNDNLTREISGQGSNRHVGGKGMTAKIVNCRYAIDGRK